jgi:hypothetical protein
VCSSDLMGRQINQLEGKLKLYISLFVDNSLIMSNDEIKDEAYALILRMPGWMDLLTTEPRYFGIASHWEVTIDKWLNIYILITKLPTYKKEYDLVIFNEALLTTAWVGYDEGVHLFITWGATAYDEAIDAAIISGHEETARYIFESAPAWIKKEATKERDRSIFPLPFMIHKKKNMLKAKIN